MRFWMLAFIFLLLLTLGNAWLMHRERMFAHAHAYAPIQIGERLKHTGEWDAFIYREIGAIIITTIVYGGIFLVSREARHRGRTLTL